MKIIHLLILFACLISCQKEEAPRPSIQYFPPMNQSTWQAITPASLGWNDGAIPDLITFLNTNNSRAFLVLKNGQIVIEEYMGKQFDGVTNFSANSNWYWASAGKTLTSALAGIAEANGALVLDNKTSDYLGTGWTSLSLEDENKITVRHQLTMTTGLDEGVTNPSCTDKSCLVLKAPPGTRWAYHNAPYTLLDGVMANATGKPLNTFIDNELKSKIGMDGLYIMTGDNNVYYSTARSMARFGLLLLNKGKWDQTQLIPETYVDLMHTASQNHNVSYGYLTWLAGKPSHMVPGLQTVISGSISADAPPDMFAAMGKNGQLINVIPSMGLVVIRLGDAPDANLVPFTFQNDLWKKLNTIIKN